MNLAICTAQRPYLGETVCGDAFTVVRNRKTLIALADGLGHGPAAAEAANDFCRLAEQEHERDLSELMHLATEELVKTRGAAAALIRIDLVERRVEFVGVGNIELQAVSKEPIKPISAAGIVGRRIRKIHAFSYPIHRGDLLATYTDGISSRFSLEDYSKLDEQQLADKLLSEHGKLHDDATCVVIRCV